MFRLIFSCFFLNVESFRLGRVIIVIIVIVNRHHYDFFFAARRWSPGENRDHLPGISRKNVNRVNRYWKTGISAFHAAKSDFMKKAAFKVGSLLVMRYSCYESHNFEWKKIETLWSNNFDQREVSDSPTNQIVKAKQQKQEKEAEIQRRLRHLETWFQWFLFFLYTKTFSRIEGELPALESQLSELRQKKAICKWHRSSNSRYFYFFKIYLFYLHLTDLCQNSPGSDHFIFTRPAYPWKNWSSWWVSCVNVIIMNHMDMGLCETHGHFVWQEEADAIRMQAECTTELPRCKPAGSDRSSSLCCAPGWDKEWRNWRRRIGRVVKSCFCANLCLVFFLLFLVCLSFPFIFLYERSDVLKATVDRSTISNLGCSSAILHVHVNCVAPLSSQEKVASLQKELAITGQAGTRFFCTIAASDFVESVLLYMHFLIIYDIHEILPPSCQEMRRPLPRQRKLCQNMQSPPDMRLSS